MRLRSGFGASALVLLACGCSDMFGDQESVPGVDQGSFAVSGTLTGNTCGAGAFGATDPFNFSMKLSKDGSKLYWNNGSQYVEGSIASDGTTFSITSNVTTQPTAQCAVKRTDSMKGTLVLSSDKITSYTGTLSYSFSLVQGSQCDAVLTQQNVTTMPCLISYSINAKAE